MSSTVALAVRDGRCQVVKSSPVFAHFAPLLVCDGRCGAAQNSLALVLFAWKQDFLTRTYPIPGSALVHDGMFGGYASRGETGSVTNVL